MRRMFLMTAVSVAFIVCSCTKQGASPGTLLTPAAKTMQVFLSDGTELNSVQDLHAYVQENGFTGDVNGYPFRMGIDGLNKGLDEGLVKDTTVTFIRQYSFLLKVMAVAEAYATSLFHPEDPSLLGLVAHLRDVQKHSFALSQNHNVFEMFGLPGGLSQYGNHPPSLNSDGFYPWEVFYRNWLDGMISQYMSHVFPGAFAYDFTGAKFISMFRNVLMLNYVPEPFSLFEAFPWALNAPVGHTIDAVFFNIHDRGTGAGVIADILLDEEGQRLGVLVKIMHRSLLSVTYMYIGRRVQDGNSTYHWKSTDPADSFNPWDMMPDFTILDPVAGGGPVITPPEIEP